MKWAAGVLAVVAFAAPARALAQASIGEFRVLLVAGSARAPGSVRAPADFPPPGGRAVGGMSASLSFVHGNFSAGPEAMVLRGSDRRMYELGGVARLGMAKGHVRPFVLIGGGVYSWDRKTIQPFDSAAGAAWTEDKSYLSGTAGGGLLVGTRSVALVLEVRGHKSLGYDEFFGSRDMLSIAAGGRISW